MEDKVNEIEDWLKQIAGKIYSRTFNSSIPEFEIHIFESKGVDDDLGRYYPKSEGHKIVRVIEISSAVIEEVWKSEASYRESPDYRLPVLSMAWHIYKMCRCQENEALCKAWIRFLDTMQHETLHLFCHYTYGWSDEAGGHTPQFLWHALRLGIDLEGIKNKCHETESVIVQINKGWNPCMMSLDEFCNAKFIEGRIKGYSPLPDNSKPVEDVAVHLSIEEDEGDWESDEVWGDWVYVPQLSS